MSQGHQNCFPRVKWFCYTNDATNVKASLHLMETRGWVCLNGGHLRWCNAPSINSLGLGCTQHEGQTQHMEAHKEPERGGVAYMTFVPSLKWYFIRLLPGVGDRDQGRLVHAFVKTTNHLELSVTHPSIQFAVRPWSRKCTWNIHESWAYRWMGQNRRSIRHMVQFIHVHT